MRIVLQGSATPEEMAKAVKELLEDTLQKTDAVGQERPLHNPVIEFSLNLEGEEKPMLLIDSEREAMLTIHSGIEGGTLTEYEEVDRSELLNKFNELMDNTVEQAEKDGE